MNKFEKLGLSEELLKSINELGFEKPTPIQENIIPVILEGCHWTSTNRNRKNFGVFKYFTYKFKRKKKETTSVYFITNKRTYHANS